MQKISIKVMKMKISIYSDNCNENGGNNTEITIRLEMTIFMQEEIMLQYGQISRKK